LDITFTRPKPDAVIYIDGISQQAYGANNGVSVDGVEIKLQVAGDTTAGRSIIVRPTGQVSIVHQ
jgi:hypothetical protein